MLREQRRQLSDLGSAAKTHFLATLGHEIRTPMTGVLGMAELLQAGALPPRQRQQVQAIQRAGEHLLRLVNDALDLARIEAGKLTLEDAPFDLHELLDEVASLLQPLANAKGLVFRLQRAPGTPRALRGDAGRVRQILLNLSGNAIKFTQAGEVCLRSEAAADGVRFEVSDTGEGMAARVGRQQPAPDPDRRRRLPALGREVHAHRLAGPGQARPGAGAHAAEGTIAAAGRRELRAGASRGGGEPARGRPRQPGRERNRPGAPAPARRDTTGQPQLRTPVQADVIGSVSAC